LETSLLSGLLIVVLCRRHSWEGSFYLVVDDSQVLYPMFETIPSFYVQNKP